MSTFDELLMQASRDMSGVKLGEELQKVLNGYREKIVAVLIPTFYDITKDEVVPVTQEVVNDFELSNQLHGTRMLLIREALKRNRVDLIEIAVEQCRVANYREWATAHATRLDNLRKALEDESRERAMRTREQS